MGKYQTWRRKMAQKSGKGAGRLILCMALVLVTILKGLDDPERLARFGESGLMRIVEGDTWSLGEQVAFLESLGYEKQ